MKSGQSWGAQLVRGGWDIENGMRDGRSLAERNLESSCKERNARVNTERHPSPCLQRISRHRHQKLPTNSILSHHRPWKRSP